ncbi:MAG: patatin-like phospholipase family protein, partial [Actinomyces graevenitzii]|nr:patatin-like phospholipase family protein [Actinomyces graevenitzii]
MRGVYTAGLVATLIESGLDFPHVSGISAGSSHTVNYVSRDAARAHDSFVDVALSPEFGGYKHWLAGRGIFNVDYLYHDIAEADGDFPFDYNTFMANPAKIRVGSFNATRGQAVWFTKEDMHSVSDVGLLSRASSTLPVLMPPVEIDGDTYVDGALGPNGGIPLDAPMR